MSDAREVAEKATAYVEKFYDSSNEERMMLAGTAWHLTLTVNERDHLRRENAILEDRLAEVGRWSARFAEALTEVQDALELSSDDPEWRDAVMRICRSAFIDNAYDAVSRDQRGW